LTHMPPSSCGPLSILINGPYDNICFAAKENGLRGAPGIELGVIISSSNGRGWVMEGIRKVVSRPVPKERERSSKQTDQKVRRLSRRSSEDIVDSSPGSCGCQSKTDRSERKLTRCSPRSTAIRTAIPVIIHSSDSESTYSDQPNRKTLESNDAPIPWPKPARRTSAMTVSLEGTESIDPSRSRATLRNTFP